MVDFRKTAFALQMPDREPGSTPSMTSGALLSLIARSHDMSISELLSIAQVSPRKLLGLIKELKDSNLVDIDNVDSFSDLERSFSKIEYLIEEDDNRESPFLEARKELMSLISSKPMEPRVSISRRGFARALNF